MWGNWAVPVCLRWNFETAERPLPVGSGVTSRFNLKRLVATVTVPWTTCARTFVRAPLHFFPPTSPWNLYSSCLVSNEFIQYRPLKHCSRWGISPASHKIFENGHTLQLNNTKTECGWLLYRAFLTLNFTCFFCLFAFSASLSREALILDWLTKQTYMVSSFLSKLKCKLWGSKSTYMVQKYLFRTYNI